MLGRILKSFMVGAAAGTVMGALYSRKIGDAAKNKISESANKVIDELTEKIDEGKKTLMDLKKKISVTSNETQHHRQNGHHAKRKTNLRTARS